MATDSEKRLLKEFMDGLETRKLCDIVRSVYHGGGISVNTREGNKNTFGVTTVFSSIYF
jgi:hypothetical protein